MNLEKDGIVVLKLIDASGKVVDIDSTTVKLQPHCKNIINLHIITPIELRGYLLVSELTDNNNITQVVRRYIRVGDESGNVVFPEYNIELDTFRTGERRNQETYFFVPIKALHD